MIISKEYELGNQINKPFLISITKTKIGDKMKYQHQHKHYEIVYFEPVEHIALKGDKQFDIHKNSFVLFPPNEKHKIITKITHYNRVLINFTYEFANPLISSFGINLEKLFSNCVLVFSDEQMKTMLELIFQMIIEYNKMSNPVNDTLKLLFVNFLFCMTKYTDVVKENTNEELKIMDVINYVNKQYSNNSINLDFLADKFYMSKYDICRKFKKVTGKSFSEYLTEIRIRQAIEYLNTTQLTVREIASLTGFSSPNYFSEVFLKKQGLPPNKYRRMI